MIQNTLALLTATTIAGAAIADVADFEDVSSGQEASFVTGGLLIEADGPNAVFEPGEIGESTGAENDTNIFGWCASSCGEVDPGAPIPPQLITVSSTLSETFSITSIDAGNLWRAEDPLGFRQGMTLQLVGNLFGGGQVFDALEIVEDTFITYNLSGFDNLISFELYMPSTQDGFPDPTIDNIVFTVPSPNALMPLAMGGLITLRRRR